MPNFKIRALAALALGLPAFAGAQTVDIGGSPTLQSFDSLGNANGTMYADTTLPNGWYMAEGTADTMYIASEGSINATGSVYSFGSVGSTERALGSIASGTTSAPRVGAQLRNMTGVALTEILISYTGEQWRIGLNGREDKLDFQYSTNATSLLTGTWVDFNALDFIAPNTTTTAPAALDGNAMANRTAVSATLTGLSLANNGILWIRWLDSNSGGADDGVAIDTVSIGPTADFAPTVLSTDPAADAMNVPPSTDITVVFSEEVAVGTWYSIDCSTGGSRTSTFSTADDITYVIVPDQQLPNLDTCTLNLDAAEITDTDGIIVNNLEGTARFTFTIGADEIPTVASTTPVDGAGNVALASNITIKFSEPVDVGPGAWYTITCASSMGHTATVSGGTSSWIIDPDADFQPGENCVVTIESTLVTDLDGMPNQLAADVTFDFDTLPDNAPSVQTFVPANNATNVPANSDVVVTFDEPVVVSGAWYQIQCVTSGMHAATVTGGPAATTTYTLNPTVDFAGGESCTVTVFGALVTDVDGGADVMVGNATTTFTTFTSDPPPAVQWAQPADNATATPSAGDVTFVFTEWVTAPASAFTITCSVSGNHTFTLSQFQNRAVLNPTVDFGLTETCTVTVNASQVLDIDGTPAPMQTNYVLDFTTQNDGTGYYAGIDAAQCSALRATLHAKIDDHASFYYSGSANLPNITPTWEILENADEDPGNTGRILDIYRNRVYTKVECRSGAASACPAGGDQRYNREHTWPNSLGFPSQTDANGNANAPYTDTHMLYLSAEDYNASRGNKPYRTCGATCPTPTNDEQETDVNAGFGGGTGTYPGNSNWDQPGGYEVWGHRKGDAARAILYMAIRFEGDAHAVTGQAEPNLELTDNASLINGSGSGGIFYMGLLTDLLAWHAADPPDAREQMRNDVIYAFQGNRNPFIDHPEYACLFSTIFANGFE